MHPRSLLIASIVCLVACSGVPGCSGALSGDANGQPGETPPGQGEAALTDARTMQVRDALIQDNRDLLEREPVLTEGKLRKMAATPYNYFRGTAALFAQDTMLPGDHRASTRYGSAAASLVRLVGDPHPENIGTFLGADGQVHVDYNDYDGSTFGPFHHDVRRLALGFFVMGHMLGERMSARERESMVREVARGYTQELAALKSGQPTAFAYPRGEGKRRATPVLADRIKSAEKDGDVREELDDYTKVKGRARVMKYGEHEGSSIPGVIGDETLQPSARDLRLIRAALSRYPATLAAPIAGDARAFFRFKGAAVRRGAGVSSYPVMRFYVLVEGPSERLDDDVLLELKESRDPLQLPGVRLVGLDRSMSNAERVARAQRAMQGAVALDALLGWAVEGPVSLKIRHRTKYQKGVGVERILDDLAKGDLSPADVVAFANTAGRLLARAHTRSETLDRKDALAAITAALGERPDGFVEETTSFVARYGPVTIDDHARLRRILETEPRLGYRNNRPME